MGKSEGAVWWAAEGGAHLPQASIVQHEDG